MINYITLNLLYKFLEFYENLYGKVSNIIVKNTRLNLQGIEDVIKESDKTVDKITYLDLDDFYKKNEIAFNNKELSEDVNFVKLIGFSYIKDNVIHNVNVSDNVIKRNDFDIINIDDYLEVYKIIEERFFMKSKTNILNIVNKSLKDLKYSEIS